MKKYELVRKWSSYKVRLFCIQHQLYTVGCCEAYDAMLKDVEDHYYNPTPEDVYRIALDICCHSVRYDDIPSIMYLLENECVSRYYVTIGGDEGD